MPYAHFTTNVLLMIMYIIVCRKHPFRFIDHSVSLVVAEVMYGVIRFIVARDDEYVLKVHERPM